MRLSIDVWERATFSQAHATVGVFAMTLDDDRPMHLQFSQQSSVQHAPSSVAVRFEKEVLRSERFAQSGKWAQASSQELTTDGIRSAKKIPHHPTR